MGTKESVADYRLETGARCALTEPGKDSTRFMRALNRPKTGLKVGVLVLVNESKASHMLTELVDPEWSRDEVDSAFRSCPCHSCTNGGAQLDFCLALEQLRPAEAEDVNVEEYNLTSGAFAHFVRT